MKSKTRHHAPIAACLVLACAGHALAQTDLVINDFNSTGFDYSFEGFSYSTGPQAVRITDPHNGWGGVGIFDSLDLSAYTDARFVVDYRQRPTNSTDRFTLELIDQNNISAKWHFDNVTLDPISQTTQRVSTTTLAAPQEGIGDWSNIDLGNITRYQILGDYDGPDPFDLEFDRLALSTTVDPPPAYAGAEPDAAWRAVAEQQIRQHRMSDLHLTVTDAGAPLVGVDAHVRMTRHDFRWGSAISAHRVNDPSPQQDPYRNLAAELFNAGTIEASLQWKAWQGEWGPDFVRTQAIEALDWMDQQGMTARGHTFVWPGRQWLPEPVVQLIDEYNDHTTTSQRKAQIALELDASVLNHIAEKATTVGDRVAAWDVVNEVRANRDLMDILGDEAVETWFHAAAQAVPDATRFLNEYNILASGGKTNSPEQQELADTVERLIDAGTPIQGIGLQSHFRADALTGPEQLWDILDRFDQYGLSIEVTEFDFETTDEQLQADYTRDFLTATFAHPSIDGITQWGFREDAHWRPDAALYRSDGSIKPNGQAYRDLVLDQWWTDETISTNLDGEAALRAFKGDYDITLEYQGIRQTHDGLELRDLTLESNLPWAAGVDGYLRADITNTHGDMQIAQQDHLGSLQLDGVYTQLDTANLVLDLHADAGDTLFAQGVSLDGTLTLNLLPGQLPAVGSTIPLISSQTPILGGFVDVRSEFVAVNIRYTTQAIFAIVTDILLIPGDINLDHSVDLLDLSILASRFGDTLTQPEFVDINHDLSIDLLDLSILAANFGRSHQGVIPEPSIALAIALPVLIMGRRVTASR
ncbi:endo-1,4-beta-xylanase [Mucisphaera calidilacus]|uniref:Beta-xylanase n=1 Tax=Mucisphaera calidilacus TaxID=2527982 RepID=A0A518BUB0_9BACT|nr:endo-1,4-beta-xylanase [Mucisphaera calidilacus]QDU70517.1 Endo-1,4-beta-xylanase Z precursor [Mucisphaera calidilacus]